MIGDVDGLIKRGSIPSEKHCEKLLQITYLPVFEPIVNWEIFQENNELTNKYFMVKTFWDRNEDAKKLGIIHSNSKSNNSMLDKKPTAMEPTIVNKRIELETDLVDSLVSKLKDIKISPFPCMCPVGCDGNSYTLTIKNSAHYIDISWWENGPANWAELTSYINEIISVFEKMFDAEL